MKRLAATLFATAAVALSITNAAAPATTSFNGLWHATDVGDGSHMLLGVAGGSTKAVIFFDASAHACLGYANPGFLAIGSAVLGTGGTTMLATMTAWCVANPSLILFGGPITFNFWTNADGTISDDASGAAFWERGP